MACVKKMFKGYILGLCVVSVFCSMSPESFAEILVPPRLSEFDEFMFQGLNSISRDKKRKMVDSSLKLPMDKQYVEELSDVTSSAPYFLSMAGLSIIGDAPSTTPTVLVGLRCWDGTSTSNPASDNWCATGGNPFILKVRIKRGGTLSQFILNDYPGKTKTTGVICAAGNAYPVINTNFPAWNNMVFCAVPFYVKLTPFVRYAPEASVTFVGGAGASNYAPYATQGGVNVHPVNSQAQGVEEIKKLYGIPDACYLPGKFPPQGILALTLEKEEKFSLAQFINDWTVYSAANDIDIADCPLNLHTYGGDGTGNGSPLFETTLDLEMIMGINPKAPTVLWTEPLLKKNLKRF